MKKITYTILLVGTSIFTACQVKMNKTDELSQESVFDELTNADSVKAKEQIPKTIEEKLNDPATEHYGIDISHYQGDIVSLLSEGPDSLKFIICKATEGGTYVDPMFKTNWSEIHKNGYIRGAYHFYDCKVDPIIQAKHFVSMITDIQSYDIPPILDIEQGSLTTGSTAEQIQSDALKFMEEVEQSTGRKPIIYSDYGFFQKYFTDVKFAEYKLWIAEYTNAPAPRIPTVWEKVGYLVWQKSANYHADSKQIDLDVVKGSLKKLIE